MNRIKIIFIGVFFITTSNLFCQNHLDFISKNNKKTLSYKQGDKIGYAKKGFTIVETGILQEINDSIITVSGKLIRIEDIRLIGHRKKGTTLISIGTAAIAGFALGYLTLPANNSTAEKIVGLSISIPLFTIGEIIGWKNRVYNVSKKYTFKVSS